MQNMAAQQQQQLALVGDQPMILVHPTGEQIMDGPIVIHPGNGGRPNIYMQAPEFHWQQLQVEAGEDQQARAGIQQIARKCFDFGNDVRN